MRTAGRGRIINISSIGGKFYDPLGPWYHPTKLAVEGMGDALRLELKPHGISVSIIEPSGTRNEWGCISAGRLLSTSGDGPYAAQAQHMAGALASADREQTSTHPGVIARAVLHAATSARPRTRYPAGNGAGAILALRRLLPDRLYDVVVMAVLKRAAG